MRFIFFLVAGLFALTACNSSAQSQPQNGAYTNLNVAEFKEKMDDPNMVILDVRTPRETAAGKIEGAIEIDVTASNFKEKVAQLDKDKTYLVYCRSGRRSVKACNILAEQGFNDLHNLRGGYLKWDK